MRGVAIDKTGEWWTSTDPADIESYLIELTAEAYPVDVVRASLCSSCGHDVFVLRADRREGAARRNCVKCNSKEFIADSASSWPDSRPTTRLCPCGEKTCNLAVGYALRDTGDVRWVTVGSRCVACGMLGAFVDWKVSEAGTAALTDRG
jgi:hypothetical protein